MQRENRSIYSPHEPYPSSIIRSRAEALRELQQPCGLFKTPTKIEDRLASFITERLRPLDALGEGQLFLGHGMPLNWQALLRYLFEQGVTSAPTCRYPLLENDKPKIYNAILPLNLEPRSGSPDTSASFKSSGASFSAEEALSKAVGEALERYMLSGAGQHSPLISFAEQERAGAGILDPSVYESFSAKQRSALHELAWNPDTPMRWVSGTSYPDGKRVEIPAQLVFWKYERGPDEKLVAPTTTSGCAGHFTREQAVLGGLLELIQRDGFLLFWLNRIAPPVLDVAALDDPAVDELIAYFKRYRLDMTFLNTTSDIAVPSITCVMTDTAAPDGPIIAVAASTGFDIPACVRHSAIEALLVCNYTRSLPQFTLPKSYLPFSDPSVDRVKRLSLWRGPDMAKHFAFFTSGKRQDASSLLRMAAHKDTVGKQLEHITAEFARLGPGYEIFTYEAAHEALDALGFHVVRCIVPRLIPLYLDEHKAPLNAKRLSEVPRKLGYKVSAERNPWPHPFP